MIAISSADAPEAVRPPWDNLRHIPQRRFCAAYWQAAGNVCAAQRISGVSRKNHYRWIGKDEAYGIAIVEMQEIMASLLESAALDRAINGWEEPVFYNGMICGHRQRYDNKLLMKMLTRFDQTRYR